MNNKYIIKKTLKRRLLVSFTLALLPVLLMLMVIIELILVPYLKNNAEEELTNSTNIITQSVRMSANVAIKNHLKALAERNREIVENYYNLYKQNLISKDEAMTRLRSILLSQKVGSSGYLYCLNSKGIVTMHPNPGVENHDQSNFQFVKDQIRLKEGYIEYDWKNPGEETERAKALYMVYFEPFDWIISVSSYRAEFSELIDSDDFNETILSAKFGTKGYAYMMDSTGKTLVHPALPKNYDVFKESELSTGFVRQMIETDSGSIEYEWRNPEENEAYSKLAIYNKIPEVGWIVASTSYTDEVFYPAQVARTIGYSSILVMLATAGFVAFFLSRRLSKPVENAIEQLNRNIEKGVAEEIIINSDDEVGRLIFELNNYLNIAEKRKKIIDLERAKYRNLFDASPDGIFLMKGINLIDCNPSTCQLFGSDRNELLQKNVIELSPEFQPHGDRSDSLALKLIDQCKNEEFIKFEWKHIRANKKEFDAEVQLKHFIDDEHQTLFVAFIRDITEKKAYERKIIELNENLEQKVIERTKELNDAMLRIEQANYELKSLNDNIADEARKLLQLNDKLASSEMELIEANKTKDKFISILAHDLRNPIGGIRSLLEVLNLNVDKMNAVDLRSMIDSSYIASCRTYELLDNLLQWAKMQHKGFDFEPQVNPLLGIVEKCVKLAKPQADYKQVAINNEVSESDLAYFDEMYIHTVIRNLITNAVKYSHPNSAVKVCIDSKFTNDKGNFIVVAVKDEGIGVDKDIINDLFKLDKMTSQPGTKGEKGTGLGLILCKEFVELHGGTIWVESELGIGSSFKFSLPIGI